MKGASMNASFPRRRESSANNRGLSPIIPSWSVPNYSHYFKDGYAQGDKI